jgi:hypothetical protein
LQRVILLEDPSYFPRHFPPFISCKGNIIDKAYFKTVSKVQQVSEVTIVRHNSFRLPVWNKCFNWRKICSQEKCWWRYSNICTRIVWMQSQSLNYFNIVLMKLVLSLNCNNYKFLIHRNLSPWKNRLGLPFPSRWLYSPVTRPHETFRFTSVTRSRTVCRTPWMGDQLFARPLPVHKHIKTHTQHKH